MPGYILHLTEAKLIIEELKKLGKDPGSDWCSLFKLGSLLPDTRRGTDKITSHFWDPDTVDNMAIAPDMQRFERKYGSRVTGPLMLGYWTHLQLDWLYVEKFWDRVFAFYNDDGQIAKKKTDITRVYLKKYHHWVTREEFFTREYYYGDYNRMNAPLMEKYHLEIPEYRENVYCPVKEVDFTDLQIVLSDLDRILGHQHEAEKEPLRVFEMPALEDFIAEAVQEALPRILKDLQQPRLLAFDLDGTLLKDDKSLSETSEKELKRLIAAGNEIVIASGRPIEALPENVTGIPGVQYALTSNGAAVYNLLTRERICHKPMTPESAGEVLKLLKKYHIENTPENMPTSFEVLIAGVPYTTRAFYDKPENYGVKGSGIYYIQHTRIPVKDLYAFAAEHLQEIDAIDIVTGCMPLKAEYLKELAQMPGLYLTASVPHIIEISNEEAGKGRGLKWLAEYLNFPNQYIYAFGNEANDMDMLEYAGCGVAVANSSDCVKEIADHITISNEEDGVAVFLKQL